MNKVIIDALKQYENEREMHAALAEFFAFLPQSLLDSLSDDEVRTLISPEHVISFPVHWVNDAGETKVNNGYRVQYSNKNGVYKGGLRFHPSVNVSLLKMLAFEQTFKNILTGLPMGGAKGGSDFDPKGKSEAEIIRFAQNFMQALAPYIGVDVDIPAGDIGVGHREIRAMYLEYVRIMGKDDGVLTGKPLDLGGSLGRKEATGNGLCYISAKCLKEERKTSFSGKHVIVSGSGNVALHAALKAQALGAKVVAMSDSSSAIYDADGLDIERIKDIKENHRGRISEYVSTYPKTIVLKSSDIWSVPCEVALPCATQFEINLDAARALVNSGVLLVAEGSNMATEADAAAYLVKNTLYLPGKAANAGGVCVSYFEMEQNRLGEKWSSEVVDAKLKDVMENIFLNISNSAKQYSDNHNYLMGANAYSLKVLLSHTKNNR